MSLFDSNEECASSYSKLEGEALEIHCYLAFDYFEKHYTSSKPNANPSQQDSTIQYQRWDDDGYDPDLIAAVMAKDSAAIDGCINISFVQKMKEIMKHKDLYATDVYKAANIDRKLFSKIYNDETYSPSKDTCLALCIALKLSLDEANDLMNRAGYAISHSIPRDVVVEYCLLKNIWPVDNVNAILVKINAKPL